MPIQLNFLKSYRPSTDAGRRKVTLPVFLGILLFIVVTAYLVHIPPREVIRQPSLKEGDIVAEDIVIRKNITIEDKERTEEQRKQAVAAVVPLYEYYAGNAARAADLVGRWFRLVREEKKNWLKSKRTKKGLARIKSRIEKEFGLEFTTAEIRTILNTDFFTRGDLSALQDRIKSLYDRKIMRSCSGGRQSKWNTIRLFTGRGEPVILETRHLNDLKKSRAAIREFMIKQRVPNDRVDFFTSIIMEFIDVNISYSMNLTREEENRAAATVNPVLIELKTGKVILRKGDEVTPTDMKILKLIAQATQTLKPRFSNFFLVLGILGFLSLFGVKFFKIWREGGINKRKLPVVLAATLMVSAAIYRISLFLFPLVLKNISFAYYYEARIMFYAIPFGFGALAVAFIFNLPGAVFFSFANAVMGGIICGWDMRVFLYVLLGNLAASYAIEYYQRLKRSPIIKASILWLLPTNLILILLFHSTQAVVDLQLLWLSILMGTFSAVVSPILANFIVPVWESLFKLITELKLIELTNLNLPVFREMLEKAPGTYHHSQMVASLAEAAARDLGLSPLLQTSMALYHDIGKIDNPHLFTENHAIYPNPHHNLSPRESAKNIISHIPDGIERAEKLKLPPEVRSSISQHHGSKLVRFFYEKALEMSSVDSDTFEDKVFRYPGDKPQNIENAIIMLADQVEAASKSLATPTDEEIKNVIRRIIDANIEENQFDECDGLTFKALNIIANSFLRKLSSIYHMRISYPGFDFKNGEEEKK